MPKENVFPLVLALQSKILHPHNVSQDAPQASISLLIMDVIIFVTRNVKSVTDQISTNVWLVKPRETSPEQHVFVLQAPQKIQPLFNVNVRPDLLLLLQVVLFVLQFVRLVMDL